MSTSLDLSVPSAPSQLPATLDFLPSPPAIHGEEVSNYNTLSVRISAAVKPADPLEEIWVRDVVDLVWEVVRLRRLKAALMRTNADDGIRRVLLRCGVSDLSGIVQRWMVREEAAVAEIDALLASAGLTMDAVMAETLRVRITDIERIDRMTMIVEARRNAALHEIERHRASFAALLRSATQNAESAAEHVADAEFEVVSPQTGQAPPGATSPGTMA
jgi:hypothetical protein